MPIKVTIIEDDEIRKQIREMVAGQLRGLIREEIHAAIKDQVSETISKTCTEEKLLEMAKREIHAGYYNTLQFREVLTEVIREGFIEFIDKQLKAVDFDKVTAAFVAERMTGVKINHRPRF